MSKLLPFRRKRRAAPADEALSDEALVAACGVGDSAALGMLFDRFHVVVFRFAARLSRGSTPAPEDVVQSTFLEAFQHAKRFRGDSSVRTWLLGIALNVWRAQVRTSQRHRAKKTAYGEQVVRALPAAQVEPPQLVVLHRDLLERLQPALAALPEHLHVAFTLCDVQEVPGVEAAKLLGVRPGTLYRRLHEARKALRAAIEALEEPP